MGLRAGAQTEAAERIVDAAVESQTALRTLAGALDGSSAGFRGAGAGAFSQAIGLWFEDAVLLPDSLGTYAAGLVQVDQTTAQTDADNAVELANAPSGGGGDSTTPSPAGTGGPAVRHSTLNME